MILLDASQIRAWDAYTIKNEPISSFDLMERAALACFNWLSENGYLENSFSIFCGKGNNGGDGLALARMLSLNGSSVTVYILEFGKLGTPDFQRNLQLLHETAADIHFISEPERLPAIEKSAIVIDALIGTGLNKPLEGLWQSTVQLLNQSGNEIISIDIPSGMYADESSVDNSFIRASHTLSFQCYKMAFLVAENEAGIGQVHILDIGLDRKFLSSL
ncbi:MAG: NAD(P)H-hydrate epimerase [Chitinophagaceae bacterium]|nr:NAD(P)H-hydrate epimerase [Chitinophagaceae bacterium]